MSVLASKGGMDNYFAQGSNAVVGLTKAYTMVVCCLACHPTSAADEFSKMVREKVPPVIFPESKVEKTVSYCK